MREMEILAENIRKYRFLKGLTQKRLAEEIGISKDYLYKIEKVRIPNIGMKLMSRFAYALDIETHILLQEENESMALRLIISQENFETLKRLLNEIIRELRQKNFGTLNLKRLLGEIVKRPGGKE